MGTKGRLDRKNRGTEEVGVTDREAGNPTGTVSLASVVGFRQAVDPTQNPTHHSALR